MERKGKKFVVVEDKQKRFITKDGHLAMTFSEPKKGYVANVVYDRNTKCIIGVAIREVCTSIGYSENAPITTLTASIHANEKHKLAIGEHNAKKLVVLLESIYRWIDMIPKEHQKKAQDYRIWLRYGIVEDIEELISNNLFTYVLQERLNESAEKIAQKEMEISKLNAQIKEYKAIIGMYQSMIDA